MINKLKVAFLRRTIHQKTKSDHFFLELINSHFEVKIFLREELSDAQLIQSIREYAPEIVLFYQLPPSLSKHLFRLKKAKFIWLPMWDGFKELTWSKRLGFNYFGLKVLCFCKKMHRYIVSTGLPSLSVQYYPKPIQGMSVGRAGPPYSFFLWQRDPQINLQRLAALVREGQMEKIYFKTDGKLPFSMEGIPCQVEIMQGWVSKNEYASKMRSVDFYMAPRRVEGIGFSFLEPFAMGKSVIAYDEATMNEYIRDKKTGYLYNDHSSPLCLKPPASLQPEILQTVADGYRKWKENERSLIDFMLS